VVIFSPTCWRMVEASDAGSALIAELVVVGKVDLLHR
jgi:hypothetical protein